MNKIELLRLLPTGEQLPVATFELKGEVVVSQGEHEIVNFLTTEGIQVQQDPPVSVFPADGLPFLEGLKNVFTTPYLFAREINDISETDPI